jgi:hypothetical protein
MATRSFDKSFEVKDPKAIQRFKSRLGHSGKVVVKHKDVESDSKRGIELLKKSLSA